MNVSELIETLSSNPKLGLHIILPDQHFVPDHFHITEVGKVHKEFIDCGGTIRDKTYCLLQVWVAENDRDHRLKCGKLAKILQMADKKLDLKDLPVEIEYEEYVVSQYPLLALESTPGSIGFLTEEKHTTCLAPDKCGVKGCC